MIVFSNLDIFKTKLLLHEFHTGSKNQLHFPSVKLTSVTSRCHLFCYKNI